MPADHRQIDGSLKNILRVSLPLIVAALSSNLLLLIDRAILSLYSLNAMNAASIAGNLVAIFCFFFCAIAGIAEVYVGQSNGQKLYDRLAVPVWQMIYFSAIGFVVMSIAAHFAEYLSSFPDYCREDGLAYQRLMMYFSPICAVKTAIASFFIGQGKTKIITFTVVVGAISNVALDWLFVFGYGGIIPALGCKGAAVASILAEVFEIAIFALVFFNKDNRLHFGTIKCLRFDKDIFLGCLKLGCPLAIGRIFELLAWYLVFIEISRVSSKVSSVYAICVSIYIFFSFVCDGISKSSATVSSNLIGQRDLAAIKKSLKIFLKLILCIGSVITLPLVLFPQSIFFFLDMLPESVSDLYSDMVVMFQLLALNVVLEAVSCTLWGVFMAGGDTRYPMIANLCSLWGTVVLPVVVLHLLGTLNSAVIVYQLSTVWCLTTLLLFYHRYRSLKWYNVLQKL